MSINEKGSHLAATRESRNSPADNQHEMEGEDYMYIIANLAPKVNKE